MAEACWLSVPSILRRRRSRKHQEDSSLQTLRIRVLKTRVADYGGCNTGRTCSPKLFRGILNAETTAIRGFFHLPDAFIGATSFFLTLTVGVSDAMRYRCLGGSNRYLPDALTVCGKETRLEVREHSQTPRKARLVVC